MDQEKADVFRLGRIPYQDALGLQERLVADVASGLRSPTLLLLEHDPVITLGRGAQREHVLHSREILLSRGVELFVSGRGGDVTYHGPGQLVGYPIIDLRARGRDVHAYLRDLEQSLIDCLATLGIHSGRRPGLTGVWTSGSKIASIGIRVQRWVTSHGFALNVSTDLDAFRLIVPCGIQGVQITSVERERGVPTPVDTVADVIGDAFGSVFGMKMQTQPLRHLTSGNLEPQAAESGL